jgi:tRNA threonylcarbamoyladenosine biosynthesis protein TsaB
MLILGIETTTEAASVGLIDGTGRAQEETRHCHHSLSRELMGMIDRVLGAWQVKAAGLDAVAVSNGPGSFTGLRIGLATAQGLAFALQKPLIAVPTIEALVSQVTATSHPVAVLQRARKNELYMAVFSRRDDRWIKTMTETVVFPDALAGFITTPTLLVGNAVETYKAHIMAQLGDLARFPLPDAGVVPSGCAVARLASSLHGALAGTNSGSVEPLYVKEPDAKISSTKITNAK